MKIFQSSFQIKIFLSSFQMLSLFKKNQLWTDITVQRRRIHMYRTMDCDQLGEEVEYLEAEVCQMKVSPLFFNALHSFLGDE